MSEFKYELVFDVRHIWGSWLFQVAGAFAIASIFLFPLLVIVAQWREAIRMRRWYKAIFATPLLCLMILLVFYLFSAHVVDRARCIVWMQRGDFETVEGVVDRFNPQPWSGHASENFWVNGVRFNYRSNVWGNGAFHHVAAHGGPIREGLQVRIAHHDGRILVLETAEPVVSP